MSDVVDPGYYQAEGDPPGTVRYWDGSKWTTGPVPMPPGQTAAGAAIDKDRYGGPGRRIGAALIDVLLYLAVIAVIVVAAVALGGDGDDDPVGLVIFLGVLVAILGMWALVVATTALWGGSPGKLAVGLRVTRDDGTTSPPGWGPAFVRTLPGLIGAIPGVGPLLNLGLQILNIAFVVSDDERRSVHDRVGSTRVVKKDRLS